MTGSHKWQEGDGVGWSNNVIIKIFATENDFNENICSQSNCESIWISIDATYSSKNSKGGEFKFHSIMNNAPAYHNANNEYLAYDGDTWFILSEKKFLDGVNGGGWFKFDSRGTLKEIILIPGGQNFHRNMRGTNGVSDAISI